MKIYKTSILITITILLVVGCKYNSKTAKTETNIVDKTAESDKSGKLISALVGDYVSGDYAKRNQGYDWIAVSVHQLSDSSIHISVRSRADKKKPTCTFDVNATKISNDLFKASVEGKNILFTFNNSSISIATENEKDKSVLNYYCSGGGSLADTYRKINEPLDEKQIDPRVFNKTLSLQNIFFDISSTGKGSIQQLTIQSFGLQADNKKVIVDVDGVVTNAEIEDLNADGFPEVLVYTASAGSGSYGNVIGYSVNNGKSLSQIYFPPIAENPKANKGYMGHDEFAIVESSLVRRFKTYNNADVNSNPTGNVRQIQYKLKSGEASRKFVVTKISEYPE